MAIARCGKCGRPNGKTQKYVAKAIPSGGLNASTICGTNGCDEVADIWLNEDEKRLFERGQRIFGFATFAAKVRVEGLTDPI